MKNNINKYDYVHPFKEGLAKVEFNKKCGFINLNHEEIVPCIYDEATPFTEGMARVELNDNYGYINQFGNEIIPCKYYYIGSFNDYIDKDGEGLARITISKDFGLIDRQGQEYIFKKGKVLDLIEGSLYYCKYKGDMLFKLGNFIGDKKSLVEMIESTYGYNNDVINCFLYISEIEDMIMS